MKRREFLKHTSQGAAVAAFAGSNLVLKGCTSKKEYDLLIKGGTVYDGTGSPGRKADVAVAGDRVVSIAPSIEASKAAAVVDASGMAVSPGFVDPHTHTDIQLLVNPKAESKIRQGVTTEIGGNCGGSWYPVTDEDFKKDRERLKERYDLTLDWRDMNGFFGRLEQSGSAVNFATLLGNGTLRSYVLGPYDRPATDDELAKMKEIVRDYMKAGAVGLSSGLEYAPSSFASTEELTELCKVVAEYGGVYATHMRSEDNLLLEAIDEALRISRESGAGLEIAHFKACYKPNWGKLDAAFTMLENAEKNQGNVQCDRYSYHAFSTGLSMFYPMWAREGKTEDFINRLKDPANDARIRAYVKEREAMLGSWDNVLISSVFTDKNKHMEGKTILAAAKEAGKPCYDFARDLIIEEENRVSMIGFAMSEDNLKRVLAHPLVTVGSDGNSLAPYGPLGEGVPHPRSYGTFPRVLGKFVRQEKIMPLETAVRKMSALAADKFGLTGRGYLKQGDYADIVVFNPDTVIDKATWSKPHVYPEGIDYVVVNGRIVVREGDHTGELPGRILKKTVV